MKKLMKTSRAVGITGYGAYVPRLRIKNEEIARVWGKSDWPIDEKSVPSFDEDVITMSTSASQNAIQRSGIDKKEIRTVFVGTESKPYAVKPSGTVIAKALGLSESISTAEYEFACKAGTEAMQAVAGMAGSGMIDYGLAIAADTSQGAPGNPLEFTTGAGAAAFIIGKEDKNTIARLEGSYSFVSDTPDFWRRQHAAYPSHGERFTGEPAYFKHTLNASKTLLTEMDAKPSDYKWVVFHQPNTKFPQQAAKMLGFTTEQYKPGLLCGVIGNTYSGASPVGLTAILDIAKPGDRIFMCSFGSGAGSDAFSWEVTDRIEEVRNNAPSTQDYVTRKKYIDYALYAKMRGKIKMH